MYKGNGDSGRIRASKQDAAEWYVHNESGVAFNAETLMQWDSWASSAGNRREYAEIAEIGQQARKMPPPTQVSRGELLGDLESEVSQDS